MRNQIHEIKLRLDQLRKLKGMSKIMKLPSNDLLGEDEPEKQQYLDREEERFLKQLAAGQEKYKKEFGRLDELKLEVVRIKNTIKNKTKVLGPEFSKWLKHQIWLLDQQRILREN